MLKPQNIVQAAEADLRRRKHNTMEAQLDSPAYEPYAFHRAHVRRARDVKALLTLAIMCPAPGRTSDKHNTRMIYGDTALLVAALRSLS